MSKVSVGLQLAKLAVIALALSGCITVGVNQLTDAERGDVADCDVPNFFDAKSVKAPYDVICQIETRQFLPTWRPFESAHAYDKGMPYACSCKPDAVIVADAQGLVMRGGLNLLAIRFRGKSGDVGQALSRGEIRNVLTCRDQNGTFQDGSCQAPASDDFQDTPNNRRLRGL